MQNNPNHIYNNKPCPKGHIGPRFKSNGWCVECAKGRYKPRSTLSKEELEEVRARQREDWYKNHDLNKLRARVSYYKHYERDKKKYLAAARAREIGLRQRTPVWADLKAISLFYENCPPGYEVDHIIPLHEEFVSGLHVLENLQYLSIEENHSKRNKFTCATL